MRTEKPKFKSQKREVNGRWLGVKGVHDGMTRVELAVAAGLVLALGGAMFFGVRYAGRLSRDTETLSEVRSAQAQLEAYRHERRSYPDTQTGEPIVDPFSYAAEPESCAPDGETPCAGYALSFGLEGRIGALGGGDCTATPAALTCKPLR